MSEWMKDFMDSRMYPHELTVRQAYELERAVLTGRPFSQSDAVNLLPDNVWLKVACEFAPETNAMKNSYFSSVEVMPGVSLNVQVGRYTWTLPALTRNVMATDAQFAYGFYGQGTRGERNGDDYVWRKIIQPEFRRGQNEEQAKVIRVDFFEQDGVNWPSHADVWFVQKAEIRDAKSTYNGASSYMGYDPGYRDDTVYKYTMPSASLSLTTNWGAQSINEIRTVMQLDPLTRMVNY